MMTFRTLRNARAIASFRPSLLNTSEPFRRTLTPLLAAFALSILASGCATSSGPSPDNQSAQETPAWENPSWPPPPQEARVKFVTAFNDDEDLGSEASFGDSLNAFITGRRRRTLRLRQPMDIVTSPDGKRAYISDFAVRNVFVADFEAKTIEHVAGEDKKWAYPYGLALDGDGNLWVTEQDDRMITVVAPGGEVIKQFTHESLERPTDIEVDSERGLVFVADGSRQGSPNHYVKVFDTQGNFLRNIGKGKGSDEGYLMFPSYLALGPDDSLYVTDTVNARISVFDKDGNFSRFIGERGNAFGMFDKPKGISLDTFGNIYVVDSGWSNVQIFNQKGEVLLYFGGRGAWPGMMRNPTGIAIDTNNRIYVGDYLNHRVDVYELVNTTAADSQMEAPPAP